MKKTRFLCGLLLLACLLTACSGNGQKQTETTGDTSPSEPVADALRVIADGASDFAILFDGTDENAINFASYLRSAIFRVCEVMIPTRSTTYLSQYEKKILIGMTGTAESTALSVQTPVDGFSVSASENSLAFYADGPEGYYLLENYLTDVLLASAQKNTWEVPMGTYTDEGCNDKITLRLDGKTVYYLVYSSDDENARDVAQRAVSYLTENTRLKLKVGADTASYDNEILFGSVSRTASSRLGKYLSEDSVVSGVFGNSYAILSNDRLGLVFGLVDFADKINAAEGDSVELSYSQNLCTKVASMQKNDGYAKAVAAANDFYGTYSSLVEQALKSWKVLGSAAKKDQALVDALIERMGNSLALYVGSSSALHNGYIVKLDTADYGKVTKVDGAGHIWIASEYAKTYFGTGIEENADGYMDVTAYCSASAAYSLYYDSETGLAVVTPKNVTNFLRQDTVINGYKNSEYLGRMLQFLNNPGRPEPGINVENTRIVVDSLDVETKYIFDYHSAAYNVLYSPAVCSVTENGKTVLYVAYEISLRSNGKESEVDTVLKKSTDNGKTWEKIGQVNDLRWASIFALNGNIYLLGNKLSTGVALLAEYIPGQTLEAYNLDVSVGGGSSNSVLISDGRLYKAFNNAIMSIPTDSDLKKASAWTVSNNPQNLVSQEWYKEHSGLTETLTRLWIEEGNVVASPDGEIYAMYRIDAEPTYGYTVLFRVSKDGKKISLEETCNGLVEFPYSQSKFSLEYDSATGLYLSLTSLASAKYTAQRNVLALVASKDLIHWDVVEVLLADREMLNEYISMWSHGYQYVDFTIADGNLYFFVREAAGETVSYHEANYMTLYTVSDYAGLIERYYQEKAEN